MFKSLDLSEESNWFFWDKSHACGTFDTLFSKLGGTDTSYLCVCNSAHKCRVDPSDKSKDSNMLSKTNNVTHAKDIDLLSQENQDYYNWHDQQHITCKYVDGQEYHNQTDQ